MRIKQREKRSSYDIKKGLKFVFKAIFNKKVRILLIVLFVLIVFLIGGLSGFLVSGFFGTLDNPSQKLIDFLHSKGMTDLRNKKMLLDENIKIPLNYISGQFSNPKKIFINIDFEDYQKIEYKRQEALDLGILISSSEDYVPATIKYGDKEVNVELRLKGDWVNHLEGNKWSFRIKVRGGDTLFGMKTFSIQDPNTRRYLNEFVYHQILKKEDIVALRYDFVEVTINGKNRGIYALEEHFEKQLIEDNQRREGIIIKFNEDVMWAGILDNKNPYSSDLFYSSFNFRENYLNWFYSSNIETFTNKKILEDPILSKQFQEARNLLELFRKGSLKTSEVFDVDKLAKYFAISTLMGADHDSEWHNIRFYYNPITSRLEPVGFDAVPGNEAHKVIHEYFKFSSSPEEIDALTGLIFKDEIFFERYIEELERVSKQPYLDNLFLELEEEINTNIRIIHKDTPWYHFSKEIFYRNQEQIKGALNPTKTVNAYLQESFVNENKLILYIENFGVFPIEVLNLINNDSIIFELNQNQKIIPSKTSLGVVNYHSFQFKIPSDFEWNNESSFDLKVNYRILGTSNLKEEEVFPWSQLDTNISRIDFIGEKISLTQFNESLEIDNSSNKIYIREGYYTLDKSLIIPEGYTFYFEEGTHIDLVNKAMILSYSPLQFSGTKENPIRIFSSDKTGQGLVVLNSKKQSILRNVLFEDLSYVSKDNWVLTGAVTFYESPVKLDEVIFTNILAEDSLNIIRSKLEIKNSKFENCFSDCLDIDFGEGLIESTSFKDSGNDGLDFSGSEIELIDIYISNPGDKGISVGEKSNVIANNLRIDGGFICVASKDSSQLNIDGLEISNCDYGFAVYQKKSEFGPASINSLKTNISFIGEEYIIERESSLSINEKIILGNKKEVYKELYFI